MIGAVQTNGLSQIFNQQSNQYSRVLEQIASGHRFTRPSDDFASFVRTNSLQSGISRIESVNQDLAQAREAGTQASTFGNEVMKLLSDISSLVDRRDADSTTADDRARINADLTGRLELLGNFISANTGQSAVVNINYGAGAARNLTFNPTAISLGSMTTGTAATSGAVNTLLNEVATFTSRAEAFNTTIDRQLTINQNMMSAREQTISAVRDVDDMRAIQQATNLEIRRNASVSMMAQANISQGVIARLFM